MPIHPTAIIDPTSKIDPSADIGPYVIIGPKTTIGPNCRLISHCVVSYTTLGEGSVVYPQASLGLEPQHIGYKGEETTLTVGSKTIFRECVTVHRGSMFEEGKTIVGNNGFFMAYSHIAHDCVIGNDVIMANGAQLAGHVHVQDKAFISTTVGIHQYVRIGWGAMISGGAMVPMDVAPFCVAQGDRATIYGLNLVGMKRAGLSRDDIKLIKQAYKVTFLSGLKLDEALKTEELNTPNAHVKIFKDFLSEQKRGFIRPIMKNEKEEVKA